MERHQGPPEHEDERRQQPSFRSVNTKLDNVLKGQKNIMALIDDVQAAIDAEGADAKAANDRVTASLTDLGTQIADLQAQIVALQAAGAATPAQLQSVLDAVNAADATVKGIDAPAPTPAP